jgi:hypothetical protein
MGGRAIRAFGIEPRRISAEEYRQITSEIEYGLQLRYHKDDYIVIPSYRSKPDFGDADILIKSYDDVNPREVIQKLFNVDPIHNGECYSFPYKDFQIDFIYVRPDDFDIALAYYSWNDAGNLCGRSFHSIGLKYGHMGLFFTIRPEHIEDGANNTHILRDVCLSKNPEEILNFCGFDYKHFQNGFDTLEEMFDWVCRGRHFNADKFKYENLNTANRTRNKKRNTYKYFLEWLEVNKHKYSQYQFDDKKNSYLPMIIVAFPHLKGELELAKIGYERSKLIKSKFNGELASQWSGKNGKDLGDAIEKFIKSFSNKNEYLDFVFDNSIDDVKQQFLARC